MIVRRQLRTNRFFFLIFFFCLACNGNHQIKLPSIQFHNFQAPKVDTRWSNFNVQSMELSMGLVFKIENPTPVPLIFPNHQFSFIFDNNQALSVGGTQNGFNVPPNQVKLITYPIECNLVRNGLFGNILGRDVPYRFEARFQVSNNTDSIILDYENSARLPLLPVIALDTQQVPRVQLTGSIKEIEISSQVNAMKGFIDILIGLGDRAVDAISILNPDAGSAWIPFKNGWKDFSDLPNSLVDPINSTITGLKYQIPLIVRNPNQFPIDAPMIKFGIGVAGRTPTTSFQTVYRYQNSKIPAKVGNRDGKRKLMLEGQINWNSIGGGLQPLIYPGNLTVLIESEMKIDLGYGPTDLKFQIRQVPFSFGR